MNSREKAQKAQNHKNFCAFCAFPRPFPRVQSYGLLFIAPIPVPLVFGKGQFERGVAAMALREFAQDPFPYLDDTGKRNMMACRHSAFAGPSTFAGPTLDRTADRSALLGKFTELAFDEAAEVRWEESRPAEADNLDVGPAIETDLQSDLIGASGNPF